jgi:hypothetical protein
MNGCDELPESELLEDEWPNEVEANDVMLAYEATDDTHGSGSGCAGLVLVLTITASAFAWILVR